MNSPVAAPATLWAACCSPPAGLPRPRRCLLPQLELRLRTVAFDRFLAQLAVSQGDAWILKGGAALEFRMPDRARATRDIDLAFTDSVDPADQLLDDLEPDPFGDDFSFRVARRRELSEAPDRGVVLLTSGLMALLSGVGSEV